MNTQEISEALAAGEFDGLAHVGDWRSGWGKTSRQRSWLVEGGVLVVTNRTSSKFFDGKENVRETDESVERFTGFEAVDFILSRPWSFQERRPDLF